MASPIRVLFNEFTSFLSIVIAIANFAFSYYKFARPVPKGRRIKNNQIIAYGSGVLTKLNSQTLHAYSASKTFVRFFNKCDYCMSQNVTTKCLKFTPHSNRLLILYHVLFWSWDLHIDPKFNGGGETITRINKGNIFNKLWESSQFSWRTG